MSLLEKELRRHLLKRPDIGNPDTPSVRPGNKFPRFRMNRKIMNGYDRQLSAKLRPPSPPTQGNIDRPFGSKKKKVGIDPILAENLNGLILRQALGYRPPTLSVTARHVHVGMKIILPSPFDRHPGGSRRNPRGLHPRHPKQFRKLW